MRIIIKEEVCNNNRITLSELAILLAYDGGTFNSNTYSRLEKKGYLQKQLIGGYALTEDGKRILKQIIDDSTDKIDKKRLEDLAEKLKEIYPKGKKDGTTYMWRGTTAEIVRKLQTLIEKYNFDFTDEEAIEATKYYVESFKGDYRYMQLLKYFLLKTARDADGNVEIKSEFMSIISNKGQLEEERKDWLNTII